MEGQENQNGQNGSVTAPAKETITITVEELEKIKADVAKTVKQDLESLRKASEVKKDLLDAVRNVKSIDPIQQESSGVTCKEFVENTLAEHEFRVNHQQEEAFWLKMNGQESPYPDQYMKFEILCDRYIREMSVEDIIKKVETKYGRH